MASLIYMSVTGSKQGLISSGCSTVASIGNKYQAAHEDEIFIYELTSHISRAENVLFQPVEIRKPVDKATPLFAQALDDNEKLDCEFKFYRTAPTGGNEFYFLLRLRSAVITDLRFFFPNSMTHNGMQPQESVSLKYATIEWEHIAARTSSCLFWQESSY
ncbi:Hcp family type VI secretion system effector [Pectobacterium polaris]|uniref:Hcp family type VI secretion system effector n=1 Tax=Pectobacterium polaris TaxID=2042057 RepID=UPI0023B0AC40|nr:Hcp family type VI secretion system effector [Pectobacterium polaris]MDE8755828.1 Hcp family type VI secretion system effector [Pectobacterium polaris]